MSDTPGSFARFALKPSEAGNVLLRSLQRFYAERKLFDVSISCNGFTLFGCHKLVLASCSSYFETLLSSTDGVAILNLDAVDTDYVKHLHTIVNFMYGHNIVIPKMGASCRQLYEAARIFGATALVKTMDIRLSATNSTPSMRKSSTSKIGSNGDFSFAENSSDNGEQIHDDEVIVLKPCGIGAMLLVNFQRFKDDEKFIDAKICCRDQLLFSCHKVVLAAFSGYFETLLLNTEGSAILNLDAVDSLYVEQLSTIINYMYGQMTRLKADGLDLLRDAAHVFGVIALEQGDLARIHHTNEKNRMKKSLTEKLEKLRHEGANTAENGFPTGESTSGATPCQDAAQDVSNRTVPLTSIGAMEEVEARLSTADGQSSGCDVANGASTSVQNGGSANGPASTSIGQRKIKNFLMSSRGVLTSFVLCHHCGKTLKRSGDSLRTHLLKHRVHPALNTGSDSDGWKQVKCAECAEIFGNVFLLRSHWESVHGQRQERRGCFHCGVVFSDDTALTVHASTCRPVASERSDDSAAVVVKKLLCKACGYAATSLSSFMAHVDTEHVSAESICHVCNLAFPDRQTLNAHYHQEHGLPMHLCPVCGKQFKTLPGYKNHLDTHGQSQQCSICFFKTTTKKNLEQHVKKYHSSIAVDATSESNLNHLPHKCSECSATFLYECLLTRHFQKRHLKLKPFICPYCGHSTSEKAALQTHIRCVHTKEMPFKCELCNFKCRTHSILNRHRKVHTGEKPYVCDQCGAGFPENKDLKSHRWKVHEKKHPFSCPTCKLGFFRKDNLLQHQRLKHRGT